MPTDLAIAFTTLFSVIFFCSFFYSFPLVELVCAAKVKEEVWERMENGVRGRTFFERKNKKCCLVTSVMYYYVHDCLNMNFSSPFNSYLYVSLTYIVLSVKTIRRVYYHATNFSCAVV